MVPSKKTKWFLDDYNEKYKSKAILAIMYKDPSTVETIVDNEDLSLEEKFLGLLKRGMPSQHIPLLLDIVGESLEEILKYLEEEDIIIFEKLDDHWDQDRINNTMQEAMLLIGRGEWGQTEENLIGILRRDSTYATALFGMGVCTDMQGKKNLAAEWFKRAYLLDPISFDQAKFMIGLV
jgi:hypothetical protein